MAYVGSSNDGREQRQQQQQRHKQHISNISNISSRDGALAAIIAHAAEVRAHIETGFLRKESEGKETRMNKYHNLHVVRHSSHVTRYASQVTRHTLGEGCYLGNISHDVVQPGHTLRRIQHSRARTAVARWQAALNGKDRRGVGELVVLQQDEVAGCLEADQDRDDKEGNEQLSCGLL